MFADGKPEDGNQVIRVKGQKWVLFSLGSPILLPLNENSDKEEGKKSKRLVVSQPICTLVFFSLRSVRVSFWVCGRWMGCLLLGGRAVDRVSVSREDRCSPLRTPIRCSNLRPKRRLEAAVIDHRPLVGRRARAPPNPTDTRSPRTTEARLGPAEARVCAPPLRAAAHPSSLFLNTLKRLLIASEFI